MSNMISLKNINLNTNSPNLVQPHSTRVHKSPHCVPQFSRAGDISITSQDRRRCHLFDLYKEAVPYEEAWNWQKSIVKERKILIEKNEDWSDTVIILQHHPVFTMGTGSSQENLNFDINDSPYPIYRTERGGEVTYHGPGQLVMYPIINLRYHKMDLHWYLRALEEVVIRVLSSTFSIRASRLDGLTGVWVGDQKLSAIGIRVAQWITYHGLALNVTADLAPFDWIIPCGIRNKRVGSIKSLLGEFQSTKEGVTSSIYHGDDLCLMEITRKALVKEFSEVFQLQVFHQPDPIFSFLGQKQNN